METRWRPGGVLSSGRLDFRYRDYEVDGEESVGRDSRTLELDLRPWIESF